MNPHKVLVIDDEPDIRALFALTLSQLGLRVSEAGDVQSARTLLTKHRYSLCLTDMRLPDGTGLELVEHIQERYPEMPVAVITAYGNTDSAVEALKKGAFDYVTKPLELQRLRAMVQTALELPHNRAPLSSDQTGLIGTSAAMERLRQQIAQVARSQAPVFISGESGSGKELVARAVHNHGPRSSGPFIPVNCGAIPSELMESEFFGHKKGSFTGAFQDKQGLFAVANGGTLFLDEVADLPLMMQVKLLRAIQEKSIRAVGSHEEKSVDVRILSATHKDLGHEVSAGHFRQDLYYRINVIEVQVPSLRQHREDIPELALLFLNQFAREAGIVPPVISPDAMEVLKQKNYPGNVRELENTLERAFTLCSNGVITSGDLHARNTPPTGSSDTGPAGEKTENGPIDDYNPGSGVAIDDYLEEIEREIISRVLEDNRWNKTATAEKLGISFRQLRYKLKKLGID